jgi:hypothetical protein
LSQHLFLFFCSVCLSSYLKKSPKSFVSQNLEINGINKK